MNQFMFIFILRLPLLVWFLTAVKMQILSQIFSTILGVKINKYSHFQFSPKNEFYSVFIVLSGILTGRSDIGSILYTLSDSIVRPTRCFSITKPELQQRAFIASYWQS